MSINGMHQGLNRPILIVALAFYSPRVMPVAM